MNQLTDKLLQDSIEIYVTQRGNLCHPEVVIQVKNVDEARTLKRLLLEIRNKYFVDHLEHCSKEVADWPAWKRQVLGAYKGGVMNFEYVVGAVLITQQSVTFEDLQEIRRRIEAELPYAVALDHTSLLRALEWYPEIFKQEGNRIVRVEGSEQYLLTKYFEAEFVDNPDHNRVMEIIAEVV